MVRLFLSLVNHLFINCVCLLSTIASYSVNSIHSAFSRMQARMNYCGSPGGGHYALLVDSEVTLHPAQKSKLFTIVHFVHFDGMMHAVLFCFAMTVVPASLY